MGRGSVRERGVGPGGALRGPQVSRGVCEMTVADLGGISPFSLTYTPGLAQTETRGGRGDSGGVHSPSPADHQRPASLPALLSVCRSVSSITDRGIAFFIYSFFFGKKK